LLSSSENDEEGRPTAPDTKPPDVNDSSCVGTLVLTRGEGFCGARVREPGGEGTSVRKLGWVSQALLAFSACSALWTLILCLRAACVVKAAGTEGLQGLSGTAKGGSPSSETLLERAESEVSSAGLAVAGKAVGTGIEGLHRSSLALTWASVEAYCPLVARVTDSEVRTYSC
jgi:hypothetical protein